MIYQADILTPASTLKADEIKSVIKATKGLIYKVELRFPPGSTGLLYVRINHGNHQVYPTTEDQYFRGDDDLISFDDSSLFDTPPYEFDVFTYNLDDTYDHSVIIRIGIVTQEIYIARFLPTYTWKYFKEMLETMERERDAQALSDLDRPFTWLP